MRIGVPRETKTAEGRVALVPAATGDLVNAGHEVWIERDAGLRAGHPDEAYASLGVKIAPDAATLYEKGRLIVKVKEPVGDEIAHLRSDHVLFCYLHLAAAPELARRLLDIGLTAIAFETVELDSGALPLLAPMSVIAGRIAAQVGTTLLHAPNGGKGRLLGGLPSTGRGKVVVFGAGQAGGSAAALLAAVGANVVVFEKRLDRMEGLMRLGHALSIGIWVRLLRFRGTSAVSAVEGHTSGHRVDVYALSRNRSTEQTSRPWSKVLLAKRSSVQLYNRLEHAVWTRKGETDP